MSLFGLVLLLCYCCLSAKSLLFQVDVLPSWNTSIYRNRIDLDRIFDLYVFFNGVRYEIKLTLWNIVYNAAGVQTSTEEFCRGTPGLLEVEPDCAAHVYQQLLHECYDTLEVEEYDRTVAIYSKMKNDGSVSHPNDQVVSASDGSGSSVLLVPDSELESTPELDSETPHVCSHGRLAVITASFCGYDSIKPVLRLRPKKGAKVPLAAACVDYIAYTDPFIQGPDPLHPTAYRSVAWTDSLEQENSSSSKHGNLLEYEYFFPWRLVRSQFHTAAAPHELLTRNNPGSSRFRHRNSNGNVISGSDMAEEQEPTYASKCLLSAKKYRVQSHRLPELMVRDALGRPIPKYSFVLWADSSRYLTNPWLYEDVTAAMASASNNSDSEGGDHSLLFYQHSYVDTLAQEVSEAAKQARYREYGGVELQQKVYIEEGSYPNPKLNTQVVPVIDTSSFVYRAGDPLAILVLEQWWQHILLYTIEDQVSLYYVLTDFWSLLSDRIRFMPRCSMLFTVGARFPLAPHDLNKPTV